MRVNVRPFTNPQSRLAVLTPAGIAGVRGTKFGVAVAEDGQTNVMTNKGLVAVSGADQTVEVEAGFASIVLEGQPPTEPKPFIENLDLALNPAQWSEDGSWVVKGEVDPFNFVWVNDQPVFVSEEGVFNLSFASLPEGVLVIRVLTPLGSTKTSYMLVRKDVLPFTLKGDRHEF